MGELLAYASAAGIQVVLETHSDHVLNGIRQAVHGKRVDASKVALYHSRWHPGGTSPTLTLLNVDREGRLSDWPEGFLMKLSGA